MGVSTHRRRLTPTSKEKQRLTSSVQALLGTALFFFARPYGRVRWDVEFWLSNCRDRCPRLSIINDYRKRHVLCLKRRVRKAPSGRVSATSCAEESACTLTEQSFYVSAGSFRIAACCVSPHLPEGGLQRAPTPDLYPNQSHNQTGGYEIRPTIFVLIYPYLFIFMFEYFANEVYQKAGDHKNK